MEQITYTKTGYYYIPDLKLTEETRPIGRWGRIHRDYLKNAVRCFSISLSSPATSGPIWQTSTNKHNSGQKCWSSR